MRHGVIGQTPVSKVHGAHLGPTGPRWAPCWPHDLCYLGHALTYHTQNHGIVQQKTTYMEYQENQFCWFLKVYLQCMFHASHWDLWNTLVRLIKISKLKSILTSRDFMTKASFSCKHSRWSITTCVIKSLLMNAGFKNILLVIPIFFTTILLSWVINFYRLGFWEKVSNQALFGCYLDIMEVLKGHVKFLKTVCVQYIPRNMHTVLLCFALLWLCNRS